MFESIHVIKALDSHQLIILQFCWAIEDNILYQVNQTASKSGYYFTNYDKFPDDC